VNVAVIKLKSLLPVLIIEVEVDWGGTCIGMHLVLVISTAQRAV
jgi:hypothetical protein